jgi:type I restriction enzyme R subunit
LHDDQLVRFGLLAEKYFADDLNTCLLKVQQVSEAPARMGRGGK